MANNAKDVLADHAAVETSVVRPARSLIEIDLDPRLRGRQELQHASQSTQYGRRKSDCRYGRLGFCGDRVCGGGLVVGWCVDWGGDVWVECCWAV